jgi:hypothetical protein
MDRITISAAIYELLFAEFEIQYELNISECSLDD